MTVGAPDDTWGRAIAAAAVCARAEGAMARVGGAAGVAARAQLDAWRAAPRAARAAAAAAIAAELRAPIPPGAARVDRGWSEPALAADPRVRAAWEGRAEVPAAVRVHLCRRVTAGWIALPAVRAPAPPTAPEDLAAWPAADVVRGLRRLSVAQLVHVALAGGDLAVARLAAGIVDGDVAIEAARRLRAAPALGDALGPVRAAAARVKDAVIGTDLGLGARLCAPHLAGDAGVRLRLVVPPAIAELVVVDGAPVVPWPAIAALIAP